MPRAVSKGRFPPMQPTAIPQGKKKIPATTKLLITSLLRNYLVFFNRLLSFGSLAPIVAVPGQLAHARAGELAQGMLLHGLLEKTTPGTMGFAGERPAQPAMLACCHVPPDSTRVP